MGLGRGVEEKMEKGMERALAQVHWAVINDDVEALKKLLEREEGSWLINGSDYDRRTPLHVAVSNNSLLAAQILLSAGADSDPLDRWRNSPLANAQKLGLSSMARLLRRYGAEPVTENRWGDGALATKPPQSWSWRISDPNEIDFEEGQLIGSGAFGEIWKANWRGTTVAVKTIRAALSQDRAVVKDFMGEVELLVKLRHPNIVQFLAAVTTEKPLMLVTEYLPGGDLHKLIQKGPVPSDLAVAFALDVARGMAYLHGGPNVVIHRDIKPRNLIIDENNVLKVGDFGLSKLVKVTNVHDVYKLTGETGSYRYMAPEVFLKEDYNSKVDVFSFAMVLYEMFEGTAPLADKDSEQAARMVAIYGQRPEFGYKTYYPERMKELITQCWSEFSVKRPDFDYIIEELELIQEKSSRHDRHCFRHLLQRIHYHSE